MFILLIVCSLMLLCVLEADLLCLSCLGRDLRYFELLFLFVYYFGLVYICDNVVVDGFDLLELWCCICCFRCLSWSIVVLIVLLLYFAICSAVLSLFWCLGIVFACGYALC